MQTPLSVLPFEAREAAGRALWARLLADAPTDPNPDPDPEQDDDQPEERDAA